jgi:hypothetical protein
MKRNERHVQRHDKTSRKEAQARHQNDQIPRPHPLSCESHYNASQDTGDADDCDGVEGDVGVDGVLDCEVFNVVLCKEVS